MWEVENKRQWSFIPMTNQYSTQLWRSLMVQHAKLVPTYYTNNAHVAVHFLLIKTV